MEMLKVEKSSVYWKVLGIQNLDINKIDPNCVLLRATFGAINIVNTELSKGNEVLIPIYIPTPEVSPQDLFICEPGNKLETVRRISLIDISSLMDRNLFNVSVIDSMDYINSAMDLMNNGIFITEENREDKYLEIIENSQENSEPEPLREGASFEEERQYSEQLSKYKMAQHNLTTLEKYLNSLDKLSKIKFVDNLLNTYKMKILGCTTEDEINKAVEDYQNELDRYFFNPEG